MQGVCFSSVVLLKTVDINFMNFAFEALHARTYVRVLRSYAQRFLIFISLFTMQDSRDSMKMEITSFLLFFFSGTLTTNACDCVSRFVLVSSSVSGQKFSPVLLFWWNFLLQKVQSSTEELLLL